MNRPNFFIIGAPKCGTTSLANWLAQHPNVYFSPTKEPHYFNDDHIRTNYHDYHDEDNYLSMFAAARPEQSTIGEGSVWYLFSRNAVSNIENFSEGQARYIVCLRNPVDMAYSLHGQLLSSGTENISDFMTAWDLQNLRKYGQSLPAFSGEPSYLQYRETCALGTQVDRLLKNVPLDRVHFVFLDDLTHKAADVFDGVLAFLDVPPSPAPIDFAKLNVSHTARFKVISRAITVAGTARHWLGLKKGFGLLNLMRRLNKRSFERKPLDPAIRQRLQKSFRDEVALLERLVGRDLSHWKN